jgi:hypothetical protein
MPARVVALINRDRVHRYDIVERRAKIAVRRMLRLRQVVYKSQLAERVEIIEAAYE